MHIVSGFTGDSNNAPETSSSAVKDPVPKTPKVPSAPHGVVELTPLPPTSVTPGTSFFLNMDHSYVAGNNFLSSRNEMSTKSLHF